MEALILYVCVRECVLSVHSKARMRKWPRVQLKRGIWIELQLKIGGLGGLDVTRSGVAVEDGTYCEKEARAREIGSRTFQSRNAGRLHYGISVTRAPVLHPCLCELCCYFQMPGGIEHQCAPAPESLSPPTTSPKPRGWYDPCQSHPLLLKPCWHNLYSGVANQQVSFSPLPTSSSAHLFPVCPTVGWLAFAVIPTNEQFESFSFQTRLDSLLLQYFSSCLAVS